MKKISLLVVLVLVFSAGCIKKEKPIGGERDDHGCLGPAGYTWNNEVGACLREWELNDNQKRAAKTAVEYVGYAKGLTIIQVNVARCPGCFAVELEKEGDRIQVTLEGWVVAGKSLTPEECTARGGRSVNIVGGDTCTENETNAGEVKGFISPNICCVPSESRGMTSSEAMEIAENSECAQAVLTSKLFYNNSTKTWWIDLGAEKAGCNPACVVSEKTRTAEINWRCTGVIAPKPGFCGTSTNGPCDSDSDCKTGGCSGQVCQSNRETPVITTCEYRECYKASDYNLTCGCVSGGCRWG